MRYPHPSRVLSVLVLVVSTRHIAPNPCKGAGNWAVSGTRLVRRYTEQLYLPLPGEISGSESIAALLGNYNFLVSHVSALALAFSQGMRVLLCKQLLIPESVFCLDFSHSFGWSQLTVLTIIKRCGKRKRCSSSWGCLRMNYLNILSDC